MNIDQKKQITQEIATDLGEAVTIYLTDFTGLNVGQMGELRARLKESGADFRVVKNTLALRALEDLDLPDIAEHFTGPTGIVLAGEDPATPAKVVRDFAKEHDAKPVVKVGVVDRRQVQPAEIEKMADLPPRDELLAGIAGGLTASVGGIAGALAAVIRDIAYLVEEVAKKGEAAQD
ncbi:MAG: 50S ribosomal protein L10 [Gemmatimonadales bacterium]|jgi:large subunit ribosomal protein L10